MIDILFSESSAGALKTIKDELYVFAFMFDVGDLSQPIDSQYRNDLIVSFYSQIDFEKVDEEELMKSISEFYYGGLKEVEEHMKKGEEFRLWVSNTPQSILGLYYFCNIVKEYDNAVYVLEPPKDLKGFEGNVGCVSWDEIHTKGFQQSLGLERKLSKEEINNYSELWKKQVQDNYPLRVLLNSRIVGVEEDFYDFLIERILGDEPIKEILLIGRLLSEYRISVDYYWFVKRIDYMIDTGKIEVIDKEETSWTRRIRRCS